MIKVIISIAFLLSFTPGVKARESFADSVYWIAIKTDSGTVHAAVAMPEGPGPFPAVIILHGTHGFAEEYVELARRMAKNGIVGIAACWFAGRKGTGTQFITPIECKHAPPLVDVPGLDRFRIARQTIDALIKKIAMLRGVRSDRLSIFGHSRGGGAALDYVLTHPGKVRSVILNSCGYPPGVIGRAAEIKIPVFILHGEADNSADGGSAVTEIEKARQFEAALRTANKDVEVKYYKAGRHNGVFSDLNQWEDTVKRIAEFLKKSM